MSSANGLHCRDDMYVFSSFWLKTGAWNVATDASVHEYEVWIQILHHHEIWLMCWKQRTCDKTWLHMCHSIKKADPCSGLSRCRMYAPTALARAPSPLRYVTSHDDISKARNNIIWYPYYFRPCNMRIWSEHRTNQSTPNTHRTPQSRITLVLSVEILLEKNTYAKESCHCNRRRKHRKL